MPKRRDDELIPRRVRDLPMIRPVWIRARITLIRFRMRNKPMWSPRHHRLARATGYFVIAYSRLEQELVYAAQQMAFARASAHHGRDSDAEAQALDDGVAIRLSDFKKAQTWAREARKMSRDPNGVNEVEAIVSEISQLSTKRQAIIHYFEFFGDRFSIFMPAWYIQALQWVRADWAKASHQSAQVFKSPVIHRLTYRDLKSITGQCESLVARIRELRFELADEFYRSLGQKGSEITGSENPSVK